MHQFNYTSFLTFCCTHLEESAGSSLVFHHGVYFDKDVSKWDMLWWKKKKCIPLNGYCPFSLGKGRVKIGRKEQIVNSQQNMQTQKRILHWSFGFYQFYEACPKYLNGLSRESSPHCRSFQTELNGTEILEIYKIRTESYCREIECKKTCKNIFRF